MSARVDHAVTAGTFSLDGETHEVENNVWVLGDDEQCVVFDAPHDLTTVSDLIGERECVGILLTHAHDDHVRMAPELSEHLEAPLLLNPADREVWQLTHGDLPWDDDVTDGDMFTIAGVDIEALHTPGHSPGSTCYYVEALGAPSSRGDTLSRAAPGRPGARSPRGRPSSSPSRSVCSRCPRTPWCIPGTARTPRSAQRRRRLAATGCEHL